MEKLINGCGSHDNENGSHAAVDWYNVGHLLIGNSKEREADGPFHKDGT